jgi:hypothetical protein
MPNNGDQLIDELLLISSQCLLRIDFNSIARAKCFQLLRNAIWEVTAGLQGIKPTPRLKGAQRCRATLFFSSDAVLFHGTATAASVEILKEGS